MKLRLPMHGRTHDPEKGSDPILALKDVIRYLVDNQGGWLKITARDSVPGGDNAIEIYALAEDGGSGDFDIHCDGHFSVEADEIGLSDDAGNTVQVDSGGVTVFLFTAGSTHEVLDHLGSPLVTYTG